MFGTLLEENPEKGRKLIKSPGLGEICKSKFKKGGEFTVWLIKRDLYGGPLPITKGH